MEGALPIDAVTSAGCPAALRRHAPPRVELPPLDAAELRAMLREGAQEVEDCERVLAWASRARGAIDVAIAEGLDALRQGDRLASLACHLDDYAREVLDLGRRAALGLARLGRGLRTRPLLRAALRSGRVRLRAAQTVLAVASGEREAEWVERAARLTVRELEEAVRREGNASGDEDEEWLRLDVHMEPDDRILVDEALALAGRVMPGSSRMERLEAIAQEFLAEVGDDADRDGERKLWEFRLRRPGEGARRAALEEETLRWCYLPGVGKCPAPEVRFDEGMSGPEIDARLRELAALRAGWEDFLGTCAHVVKESGVWRLAGFASFRHYVEERLGLPARAVEQRAWVERRLSVSPALRETRRQKVPFEKLRLVARLSEREIGAWTARARAMTCVELERALEREADGQMRARRRLVAPMPRRIAVVVGAAIEAVEERSDGFVPSGKCLAIVAWHFLETWKGVDEPRRTRSREVRERDGGSCQVPACSRRATHAHHVDYRSHAGGEEPENLVGVCGFHHLRCIHGGWLRVVGRAPDALTWFLRGEAWTGPRGCAT